MRSVFVVLCVILLCFNSVYSYKNGEQVDITVNNIRPFNNPAETYEFYSLPFCGPSFVKDEGSKFGDALAGDRRVTSAYEIFFRTPIVWQRLCQFRLTQDDIQKFISAIEKDYMFEMFVDGLPVMGFVGDMEHSIEEFSDHKHNSTRYFLYTHLAFSLAYNSEHPHENGDVIACNITTNRAQRIELIRGEKIIVDFSYSAKWVYTPTKYENRMALHQKALIGDQALEIHWLSIVNSFVLVILLTTFLAIILMRVLKNDFARYMDAEADEIGAEIDDSGWKQLHGDVFRFPPYPMILASMLGTGTQILTLVIGLLLLSLVGLYYPGNAGALYTSAIVLYAFTSGIAGYISTTLYLQFGGDSWATNAVVTALNFTGPLLFVFSCLNSVALKYNSTSALPFSAIFYLVLIWAVVTFPLTIFGSIRAKRSLKPYNAPTKTKFAKREIPSPPWYRTAPFQYFMAGFLPFSAIYIELHYTFSAIWGHRVYTLFGILSLAFIMLIAVTSFITIALTYFQLAIEDYRWWWRSFLSGGAAGVFIYGYAIFYFVYRSNMDGFMQSSFYFGYVFIISYGFFLMLGSVGFFSARWFVHKIYSSVHID